MYLKSLSIILLSLMLPLHSSGQNWEVVANGVNNAVYTFAKDETTNRLFLGGMFKTANGVEVNGIAQWDGSVFTSLGTGIDNCNPFNCSPIHALFFYDGLLYARIPSPSVSGTMVNGIASWNGNTWNALGSGIQQSATGLWGGALTMTVFQNNLVVGGSFDIAGGETAYSLATWDGDNWQSLNFPKDDDSTFPIIMNSSTVFNGNLFVGGNFEMYIPGDSLTTDIGMYDGDDWHSVGGGIKGPWSIVSDLIVYKNELYVCGLFYESGGNGGTGIMKLKNNEWVGVGGSFDFENTICEDMIVYNDELYVFGIFDYVGGGVRADNVAKWDGEKWCGLGGEFNNKILSAEVFNDELFIGGGFETIDQDTFYNIVKWVGGQNVDTCGNVITSNLTLASSGDGLLLYPNPTNETINIDLSHFNEDMTLSILNFNGKILYKQILSSPHKLSPVQIKISDWPKGIYVVEFKTLNQVFVQKFVVQ